MIRVLQKDLIKGRIYWHEDLKTQYKFIGNSYDERIYIWKFKYISGIPVLNRHFNRDGYIHLTLPDNIWYWDGKFKYGR